MAKKKRSITSTFNDIRADWDMSRQSRFIRRRTGVAPQGSGPDYHYRTESKYYADIEQARDMDRNDPLINTIIDRRVDNIIQGGFTLDPKTGDDKLDLDLYQRWEAEANDPDLCDVAGELTFKEIERQCERSKTVDGDIIVVGTEGGQFQLLESHLIQTKTKADRTFLGVTTDQYNKRTHYHLLEEVDVHGRTIARDPIEVRDSNGVRQLFHVYDPKRANQTRGITQIAPVFAYSGMLEDINFAKLVQQQVVSCFSIIRTFPAGTESIPSVVSYGATSTESSGTVDRGIDDIAPGAQYRGQPGEQIDGFSPNIPNSEYFEQVKLILQIIGVNFGLPLCLTLMDGSETNFSGWRGAVDEARKGFVGDQLNLVRRLHKPAYVWKVNRWMENDSALRSAAKELNIFAHNWNLPTWSYIEPVADAQGDAEQLKNALTSPRRLHAARGKDWEEVSEEIIEDNHYAIQNAMSKADELNKKFPQGPAINWRDLISLPMPSGMTMSMQDPAAVKVQEQQAGAVESEPKKKDSGADEVSAVAELDLVQSAFCPTGDGGGIDNSCGGGEGGGVAKNVPGVLYHGTSVGALRKIATEGLKQSSANHGYLAESEQYSQSYADRKGGVLLRVKTSGADIKPDNRIPEGGDYLASHTIAPENIEVKTSAGWVSVSDLDLRFGFNPKSPEFKPQSSGELDSIRSAFCPTGDGGGIDNSCGKGEGGGSEKQPVTPAIKKWFGDSKVVDDSGEPLLVHHVTAEQFDKFDPKQGAQGVVWFTSSKEKIDSNETGASLRPGKELRVVDAYLKVNKMAGWDEYEKYSLGQIQDMGFDGIKLDDDYVVFKASQIKQVASKKLTPKPKNIGELDAVKAKPKRKPRKAKNENDSN